MGFSLGFSCCPYYQGVRYSRVSARRELAAVAGEKKSRGSTYTFVVSGVRRKQGRIG